MEVALVAKGDAERGTHLLGAGAALCEALDVRVFDDELGQRIHEHAVADAKAALGEEAFAAAWEDSREMTPDEIVGFASSHP